jgi:hypothetical protein
MWLGIDLLPLTSRWLEGYVLLLSVLGGFALVWRARRNGPSYAPAFVVLGIPALQEAMPAFERELTRARRYQRPATMVAVDVSPADCESLRHELLRDDMAESPEFERLQVRNLLHARLATMLGAELRETDVAAFGPKNGLYYILLPEADRSHAEALGKRLQESFRTLTGVSLALGVALFPDEELVVQELLSRASAACAAATEREPRIRPVLAADERRSPRGIESAIRESAGSN